MESKDFIYRNLIVWQKAMAFSKLVYDLVRAFPAEESTHHSPTPTHNSN